MENQDESKALPLSRSQQAVELVRRGMSQADAARKFGISRASVSGALKIARRGPVISDRAERLRRLRARPEFLAKLAAGRAANNSRYRQMLRIPSDDVVKDAVEKLGHRSAAKALGLTQGQVAGIIYRSKRREAANA